MNFADALHTARPATSTASLKGALIRAGIGLGGLALLPLLSAPASFSGQLLKVLLGLAGACTLAYGALRLLARRIPAETSNGLQVVSTTALAPRCRLAIVEADGRRYLLACGDSFVHVVDCLTPPEPPSLEAHLEMLDRELLQ